MTDRKRQFLMMIFVIVIMGVFGIAALKLGDVQTLLSKKYIAETKLNLVTEIYLDYRIFDTMLESLLLLVSVIAVVQFSNLSSHERVIKRAAVFSNSKHSEVMSEVLRTIFPVVLIFGVYVIFNGALSPGGGFQGGAVLAAAFMCRHMAGLERLADTAPLAIYEKLIYLLIITSITFFILFRPFFLPYRETYMLLMNTFIGAKVFLGLVIIFYLFINRGE